MAMTVATLLHLFSLLFLIVPAVFTALLMRFYVMLANPNLFLYLGSVFMLMRLKGPWAKSPFLRAASFAAVFGPVPVALILFNDNRR
jgi:hypothetical protein